VIKIAFIKYGGCALGGTETFLRSIANNIDKEIFEVHYFYCDSTTYISSDYKHMDTNPSAEESLKNNGVKLHKFSVESKDLRVPTHDWVGTNFWDIFDEKDFDLIQTGRAGHPEYPFYLIKNTPIIDSIHLNAGADNQKNISRVLHLANINIKNWVNSGGDKKRVRLISLPIPEKIDKISNLRDELGIDSKSIVLGLSQRKDDAIYSEIPLKAYSEIEEKNTAFILLGGSTKYAEQARELNLNNFYQLDFDTIENLEEIFLNTLTIYTHGRKDGEINSMAIANAMRNGLPVVSHFSEYNNGHFDQIGEAGKVCKDSEEYLKEVKKLINNTDYYEYRSKNSFDNFNKNYEIKGQINKIENIYIDAINNPYVNSNLLYLDIRYNFLRQKNKIKKYTTKALPKLKKVKSIFSI
tara:strand:+ start:7508 stop:8737 length:1230 start_codon:yes stop_codon:yes gene_type:complete